MANAVSVATFTEKSGLAVPLHANYMAVRRFSCLDGLRCAAILAVFVFHIWKPSNRSELVSHGFLGVDLFFVISGYLIVTLLLRERDRVGRISLKKFYARRSLRIFPLYYAVLAGTTVLLLLGDHESSRTEFLHALPALASYTNNWINSPAWILTVAWSLAAEEQFYLVWPPIERYFKPSIVLSVLIGLIVLNQIINFSLPIIYGDWGVQRREILDTTFTPICLGVLLAHALHNQRSFNMLAGALGRRWFGLAMAGVLLGLCAIPGDVIGWRRLLIQLVMTALVGACVIREDGVMGPLLRWGPVQRVGTVSYGIYLLHMFAWYLVGVAFTRIGWLTSGVIHLLATALAAYVIAEMSYRLFEMRFLTLKTRFVPHRPS